MREKILANYNTAAQSLARISKTEFDANDRTYLRYKIDMLDSIAFVVQ
jgi:hypothetical protein